MKFNLLILLMLLFSFSSFSQTININKTDGTTESFSLSSIESITFGNNGTIVDGLISYYPFDGNADDVVGGNNGTPMNGAMLTNDRKGNPESAYLFDGSDDFIKLSKHLNDFTIASISVWVKYTKTSNQVGNIITDANTESGNDFRLDVRNTGIGVVANKGNALLNMPNGTAVTELNLKDAWHHIVWTMDSTESKIYVDGNLKSTIEKNGSNVGYHSDYAVIGTFYKNTDSFQFKNWFQGSIDELRIYNKVLTQAEVTSLFNK